MHASEDGHLDIVEELLANGAAVDAKGVGGETSLYLSSQNGHTSIVQALLEHGAAVDEAASDGRAPLRAGATYGHEEVVRLLLDHGADVNLGANDGSAALDVAAFAGHLGVVRVLLERGANVNRKGLFDATPVIPAASAGHAEVVQLLIEHGADVTIPAVNGQTALQFAAENGHDAVVGMLRKATCARLTEMPEVTVAQAQTAERCVVQEIIESGTAERLVIAGVQTQTGDPSALTISAGAGELWSLEMELPSDRIYQANMRSVIFGPGSVHRFSGEVHFDDDELPVFIGEGGVTDRLTFVLLADIGYVYVRGSGRIVFPDGRTVELGN
jgi:hypothetical protein